MDSFTIVRTTEEGETLSVTLEEGCFLDGSHASATDGIYRLWRFTNDLLSALGDRSEVPGPDSDDLDALLVLSDECEEVLSELLPEGWSVTLEDSSWFFVRDSEGSAGDLHEIRAGLGDRGITSEIVHRGGNVYVLLIGDRRGSHLFGIGPKNSDPMHVLVLADGVIFPDLHPDGSDEVPMVVLSESLPIALDEIVRMYEEHS